MATDTELLFFLCLERLDVKVSSRGFISGGIFEILRKSKAKYIDMHNATMCSPPVAMLMRYVESIILVF